MILLYIHKLFCWQVVVGWLAGLGGGGFLEARKKEKKPTILLSYLVKGKTMELYQVLHTLGGNDTCDGGGGGRGEKGEREKPGLDS